MPSCVSAIGSLYGLLADGERLLQFRSLDSLDKDEILAEDFDEAELVAAIRQWTEFAECHPVIHVMTVWNINAASRGSRVRRMWCRLVLVLGLIATLAGTAQIAVASDLAKVTDQIPPLKGGMANFLHACNLPSSANRSIDCNQQGLTIFLYEELTWNAISENSEMKHMARAIFREISKKVDNIDPDNFDELVLCQRLKTRSGLCSVAFFSDQEGRYPSGASVVVSPREDGSIFDIAVFVDVKRH
ncbi:hypothetical protein [Rhizobium sp. RU36D]|uniref:hypothetical protein n=1 Tax=Rhizobium sp. RU36D TaxID=1907415 RepID=UPI000A00C81A|nr:hypothetical protein [Rhizobium sp. RU36D]